MFYWKMLKYNVETYLKGYKVYLTSKTVMHKLYKDLQFLQLLTYHWKNVSIDFITSLLILTNWKNKTYNFILVIIDRLTKIVYYNPIKVRINAFCLAKVIIGVIIQHPGLSNSIIINRG